MNAERLVIFRGPAARKLTSSEAQVPDFEPAHSLVSHEVRRLDIHVSVASRVEVHQAFHATSEEPVKSTAERPM